MSDTGHDQWIAVLEKRERSEKSWLCAFLLSVFFGLWGVDRFYLGSWMLGFVKLCTFGGFGIWWLLDVYLLLCDDMKDSLGRIVSRDAMYRN